MFTVYKCCVKVFRPLFLSFPGVYQCPSIPCSVSDQTSLHLSWSRNVVLFVVCIFLFNLRLFYFPIGQSDHR